MKNTIICVVIFLLSILCVNVYLAQAAETMTQKTTYVGNDMVIEEFAVTCSATGAATLTTDHNVDGWLYLIEVDPGSPAPTDNYGFTLTTSNGVSITEDSTGNMDTTSTERVFPQINGDIVTMPVNDRLTFTLADQSVSGAKIKFRLYLLRP